MRRPRTRLAFVAASAALALSGAPAAGHNAGCVQTGTEEYVFVGSNKESPAVPEQNPNSSFDPREHRQGTFLDLQPETPGSDQYGARFAADQRGSAVERPFVCEPDGPRADNSP